MLLNKQQVLKYLPHREPFLFIDEVETIEVPGGLGNVTSVKDLVGTTVTAYFTVTEDLDILRGHFPGNPILPGVVQVEMMAQASAFVSLGMNNLDVTGVNVETLLLGTEACKFRKPIKPGMRLKIISTLEKTRAFITQYTGEVYHGDELIAQSKILAKLVVKKDQE